MFTRLIDKYLQSVYKNEMSRIMKAKIALLVTEYLLYHTRTETKASAGRQRKLCLRNWRNFVPDKCWRKLDLSALSNWVLLRSLFWNVKPHINSFVWNTKNIDYNLSITSYKLVIIFDTTRCIKLLFMILQSVKQAIY